MKSLSCVGANLRLDVAVTLVLIMAAIFSTGCATTRTKYNDPVMRVMVDPDAFDTQDVMWINHAIASSGRFTVIDRGVGLKAAMKEQEFQHKGKRVDNAEKYARWKKLYGAGGIITGHGRCNHYQRWALCVQQLQIINASTGEVIATAARQEEFNASDVNWNDTVEMLNKNFPDKFVEKENDERLEQFRKIAKQEAESHQDE